MSLCVGLLFVLEHRHSRVRRPPRHLLRLTLRPGAIVPFHCPENRSRPFQASISHSPDQQAPPRLSPQYQAWLYSHSTRVSRKQVMKVRMCRLMDTRNSLRVNPRGHPIPTTAAPWTGSPRFRLRPLTRAIQWIVQYKLLVLRLLHRPHFPPLRRRQHLRRLPQLHHVNAHDSTFLNHHKNYTLKKTSRWMRNHSRPTHAGGHSSSRSSTPPPVPA